MHLTHWWIDDVMSEIRDNIVVSGDANSLPTPSLSDKVEPLQKATKGSFYLLFP